MTRRGFTLVEVLTCLSVIAILAVILIPAVNHSLRMSRATACASNLRQIGIAMTAYANDNDNRFPHAYDPAKGYDQTWMWSLKPYVDMPEDSMGYSPLPKAAGIFVCPEWEMTADRSVSYAMNASIDPKYSFKTWNYNRLNVDSEAFLVVECAMNNELFSPLSNGEVPHRHPNETSNYLFADGHVEAISGLVPPSDPRWFRK